MPFVRRVAIDSPPCPWYIMWSQAVVPSPQHPTVSTRPTTIDPPPYHTPTTLPHPTAPDRKGFVGLLCTTSPHPTMRIHTHTPHPVCPQVVLSSDEEVFGGHHNVTKEADAVMTAAAVPHDNRPFSFLVRPGGGLRAAVGLDAGGARHRHEASVPGC